MFILTEVFSISTPPYSESIQSFLCIVPFSNNKVHLPTYQIPSEGSLSVDHTIHARNEKGKVRRVID